MTSHGSGFFIGIHREPEYVFHSSGQCTDRELLELVGRRIQDQGYPVVIFDDAQSAR